MDIVLLDTNILLSIFELKLDVLSLIDLDFGKNRYFTLQQVIDELRHNSSKEAVMALQLAKKLVPIREFESNKSVDDALIDYCVKNSCILATQDKELIQKAKTKHLKVLQIRQKKYLNLI